MKINVAICHIRNATIQSLSTLPCIQLTEVNKNNVVDGGKEGGREGNRRSKIFGIACLAPVKCTVQRGAAKFRAGERRAERKLLPHTEKQKDKRVEYSNYFKCFVNSMGFIIHK